MTNAPDGMAATNYFDDLFLGRAITVCRYRSPSSEIATAYLDGKPLPVGKKKPSKKERDSLFWSSNVVKDRPAESWHSEHGARWARYVGQEPVLLRDS
ncbi:MAG: hypothetical protein IPJ97_17595 [Proteobacteria bacterium]|nr:hypothetical protein [Pseudomonadota bacterium]